MNFSNFSIRLSQSRICPNASIFLKITGLQMNKAFQVELLLGTKTRPHSHGIYRELGHRWYHRQSQSGCSALALSQHLQETLPWSSCYGWGLLAHPFCQTRALKGGFNIFRCPLCLGLMASLIIEVLQHPWLHLVVPSFLVGARMSLRMIPVCSVSINPLRWCVLAHTTGVQRPHAQSGSHRITQREQRGSDIHWDDKALLSAMINTIGGCLKGNVGLAQTQGTSYTPASMYMCDFP